MKKELLSIVNKYLEVFSDEQGRQARLISYLSSHNDGEITDWNNFDGHVTAGGFIYSKVQNKFLVLYHKDLKMYLYPGGHAESFDNNPLESARREVIEETGLTNLEQFVIEEDSMIPIDIDTHMIGYNERLNLPAHYHFDFRYLFIVDKLENVNIDTHELANYKWIDINELYDDPNYGSVAIKLDKFLSFVKMK